MKNLFLAKAISLGIALTPLTANAAGGWIVGGNKNGDASIALGLHEQRWGFLLGVILNADYQEDDVLDYPVPHGNYTNLGEHRIGNQYAIDATYKLLAGSRHSLTVTAGLGVYEKAEIARSNATGWLYNQGEADSGWVAEGGLYYAYQGGKNLGVVLGAHSQLGAQAGLLFSF